MEQQQKEMVEAKEKLMNEVKESIKECYKQAESETNSLINEAYNSFDEKICKLHQSLSIERTEYWMRLQKQIFTKRILEAIKLANEEYDEFLMKEN